MHNYAFSRASTPGNAETFFAEKFFVPGPLSAALPHENLLLHTTYVEVHCCCHPTDHSPSHGLPVARRSSLPRPAKP